MTAVVCKRRSPPSKSTCDKITRRAKFRLTRRANHLYQLARPARKGGRAHVTKVAPGCVGRDGRRKPGAGIADGEGVWPRSRDAGIKLADDHIRERGGKEARLTEESAL